MNPALIFVGCYFLAVAVLVAVGSRYRARARVIIRELRMLDLTPNEMAMLDFTENSLHSMRFAYSLTFSFLEGIVVPRHRLADESKQYRRDFPTISEHPLGHELADCSFASYVSANPIFGVPACIARLLFTLRVRALLRKPLPAPAPVADARVLLAA